MNKHLSIVFPSGGELAVAQVVTPDFLPCDYLANQPLSIKRRCEKYSWQTLAREILNDNEAEFYYNEVGAPQIVNSELKISVSHSSTLVAVIVSPIMCAVDIESLDRNFERIATKYASPQEQNELGANSPLPAIWSIKETLYKYGGRREINLISDIQVLSITDDSFTARLLQQRLEGSTMQLLGHTLSFIG